MSADREQLRRPLIERGRPRWPPLMSSRRQRRTWSARRKKSSGANFKRLGGTDPDDEWADYGWAA